MLPVVPMFHANAWGMPYAAVMVGAKIVLPGRISTPRASSTCFSASESR
jgi:fatty-acyl-CoA synthase